MDPGGVVWMPGGGFKQSEYDAACAAQYGNYHACGTVENYYGGTLVYCCPN